MFTKTSKNPRNHQFGMYCSNIFGKISVLSKIDIGTTKVRSNNFSKIKRHRNGKFSIKQNKNVNVTVQSNIS